MSKLILPNAAETVELGSELIRERILERITELENTRFDIDKEIAPTVGKGAKLKKTNLPLYRSLSKIKGQLKSLRRGLGGLLTMDPDAVVNPKTKETWGMLVKEIVNENITGQALADRFKKFGSFVYTSSNVQKGKVGHHRTALNILRDILQDKPFEFRSKFKDLASKAGYMVGEEFIDFIDPASHNYFSTNVEGALLKKLGIKDKKLLPPKLVEALADRYAHALRYGSGAGIEVPADFLKKDVNVDSLFAFSRPYLEGARRGADAAQELDAVISGDNWETADDLIEAVNKIQIRDTSDLLDWRGNPIFKQTKASKVSKASALGPNKVLLTEGVDPSDISDEFLTKNHLLRDTLQPVFQKVKQVGNLPGVKPTLEVLDTVRKNPVVAAVSTLPVLSAFDIAEAATSGVKLYQNQWDTQDEELAKREKLAEQLKFTAGTTAVSSLTPAGVVTGPVSLMSGATALVLENRNNREKTKRALVDARINKKVPVANDHLDEDDPQYGVAELKQWDQNIIDKTKSKYWNWVNEQDWLSPYHSNQLNLTN